MSLQRALVVASIAAAFALAGCSADLKIPPDAGISCASGTCPDGFTCNRKLERCIWNQDIDTVPPALVGTPAITPAIARSGSLVRVAFDVSEPLRLDPAVTLAARAGDVRPLFLIERTDRHYVYGYVVTGTEDEGDRPFTIALDDLQGVTASPAGGSVRLDFHAPMVISKTLLGSPARDPSTPTLQLVVSEPLAADPVVGFAFGGTFTRTAVSPDGLTYDFAYATTGTEPQGAGLTVLVTLVDPAGNSTDNYSAGTIVFDFQPPQLFSHVLTGSPTKDAATLTLTLLVSEPLGSDPVVRFANPFADGSAFTRGSVSPNGFTWVYTFVAKGTEPQGTDEPILVSIADPAGNATADVAAGTASFDFVAPTLVALPPTGTPSKLGGTVAVTFTVSEPLTTDPVVQLAGGAFLAKRDFDGVRTYTYDYLAKGAEPQGASRQLLVTLVDPAGNATPGIAAGSVLFDFVAPTLVSPAPPFVTPVPVKAGTTVPLTLVVSEPLGRDPWVRFAGGKDYTRISVSADGKTWGYEYVPDGTEYQGASGQQVLVSIADLAGNFTESISAGAVTFDFTPPAFSGTLKVTPTIAFPGDVAEFTFAASEPLAGSLSVKLATTADDPGIPFARDTAVSPPNYRYTHTMATSDGGGSRFFYVTMADPSGNVATNLVGPSLEFVVTSPDIADLKTCDWDFLTGDPCAATNGTFSNKPGFNQVKTSFSLAETPQSVEVKVGTDVIARFPDPYSFGSIQPVLGTCWASTDFRYWVCNHAAKGTEGAEEILSLQVNVQWNSVRSGSKSIWLKYDNQPPALSSGFLQRCDQYGPAKVGANFAWLKPVDRLLGSDCPFQSPTCTNAGNARILLTMNDTVRELDATTGARVAAAYMVQGGTTIALETGTCPGIPPDQIIAFFKTSPSWQGAWSVYAQVEDPYGNPTSPFLVGAFAYDATVPSDLDTATASRVSYTRAPWGDGAGATTPVYRVSAVAGVASLPPPDGTQVSAVVLKGPTDGDATPLGCRVGGVTVANLPLNPDGSFTCDLPTTSEPPAEVWVAQEDVAGNRSQPVLVHDGTWTAQPGGAPGNPNKVTALEYWPAPRDAPSSLLSTLPDSTWGTGRFERADQAGTTPPRVGYCAASWIPELGQVLLFGGQHQDGNNADNDTRYFGSTFGWNGRAWGSLATTGPAARSSPAIAHDRRRAKTVLFGGRGANPDGTTNYLLADTWEFDASGWREACTSSACQTTAPAGRRGATMFWDPNAVSGEGRVMLFGGRLRVSGNYEATDQMYSWDGAAWAAVGGTKPDPRAWPHVATDPSAGRTILFSGTTGTEGAASDYGDDVWVWQGGAWTKHSRPGGVANDEPTLSYRSGRFWYDAETSSFRYYRYDTQVLWTWNDTTHWFDAVPGTPGILADAALTDGQLMSCGAYDELRKGFVRFGGCKSGTSCRMDGSLTDVRDETFLWRSDAGAQGTWRQLQPVSAMAQPGGRTGAAVAWNPANGFAFLWGGTTGTGELKDGWRWDGWRWTSLANADAAGLAGASLATWGTGGPLVRYGGTGGANTGAAASTFTASFSASGTAWTRACADATCGATPSTYLEPIPMAELGSPRADQSLVYYESGSPAAGYLLYFSGQRDLAVDDGTGTGGTTTITRAKTWKGVYDGAATDSVAWSFVSGLGSEPTAVTGHRMTRCTTAAGDRVVLFGGKADATTYMAETWTWDGTAWTHVSAAGPSARADHVQFCDPSSRSVVVVGGVGGAGLLSDVWTFDGTTWSNRTPTATPPARQGASSALLGSGAPFLFGGAGASNLSDTWTWAGGGDERPAHLFTVPFAGAGVPLTSVRSLTVDWEGGASSKAPASPFGDVAGTRLHAWSQGGWSAALATGSGTPSSPAITTFTTGSGFASWFTGDALDITLAAVPAGVNGSGIAELRTVHPKIEAVYRLCVAAGRSASIPSDCCSGSLSSGKACNP